MNYTEESLAVAYAFNTTGDDGRLDGTTTDVLALVEKGVAASMMLRRITAIAHSRIGHHALRRCGLQQSVLSIWIIQ